MNVRTAIATLLIAVPAVVVPRQAQAGEGDKGSFYLSGQLGFSYYLENGGSLDLNIAPRVLYFPVKGLGVGGEAGFYLYSNGYRQMDVALGPRVAYYIKPDAGEYPRGCCLTPWFGGDSSDGVPFFGASLMYLMDRNSHTGGGTASGLLGRVGVGAAPTIGDFGTAFIELGYQRQWLKYGGASQTSSNIYLEAGFGVGAFVFFKR